MNIPSGFQNPDNFPNGFTQNYPPNYPYDISNTPPNPQNIQQHQSDAYALATKNLISGNKLFFPFDNCRYLVLYVFMTLTGLMAVETAPKIAIFYTVLVFLIEEICFL